ncbi:MAG TPA: hypothetical protein VF006_30150 [Longimicrobium sp.]
MSTTDTPAAQTATPIEFMHGAFSAQVEGHIGTADQKLSYSVVAEEGQFMIVNVIGRTPMMATDGVVVFPNGQQTGGPGGVVMNQALPASGTYIITAGQHLMATNVPEGDLVVEVIVLPSYLLNQQ